MERNSSHWDTVDDGEAPTLVLGHCRKRSETPASPTEQPRPSSTDTSPGRRRNRSRKLVPTVEGDKIIAERFRTKLCRNYLQHPDRPCPYEDRCMFAHGDHELRTAAQNVADGLMSEDAIRDFKQKEGGVRSTSLSRSSSMSSASAVPFISRLVVPSPHTLLNREGLAHSDLFWGSSQSSQDDGSGAEYLNLPPYHDAMAARKQIEPTLRGYTQSPSHASRSTSSVASSLPAAGDRRPSVSGDQHDGSTFPQPWYNNPETVSDADSSIANRNSAGGHTYTHDPYSWRAV